jgi:hypothetical protein
MIISNFNESIESLHKLYIDKNKNNIEQILTDIVFYLEELKINKNNIDTFETKLNDILNELSISKKNNDSNIENFLFTLLLKINVP